MTEERWRAACRKYAKLEEEINLYDTVEKTPRWFAFCRIHDRAVEAMSDGNLDALEAILEQPNFEGTATIARLKKEIRFMGQGREDHDLVGALVDTVDQIADFFEGDARKTDLWFHTNNTSLGDVSPMEMVLRGRFEKLLAFIVTSLDENKRA